MRGGLADYSPHLWRGNSPCPVLQLTVVGMGSIFGRSAAGPLHPWGPNIGPCADHSCKWCFQMNDNSVGLSMIQEARHDTAIARREALVLRSENDRLQALLNVAEQRLHQFVLPRRPAPDMVQVTAMERLEDLTLQAENLLDQVEGLAHYITLFIDTVRGLELAPLPFSAA